jgi:type I restriction enzyme R subunit
MYEPAMRHLIDAYIQATDSAKISAFDDLSLIQLVVERGAAAVEALPQGIASDPEAVAETIENNLRRLIIDEHPINPRYYERMSELLDTLIHQRRDEALEYKQYLAQVVELTRQAHNPSRAAYPQTLDTAAKRALYDNLENDEQLALALDDAIRQTKKDNWRGSTFKEREVKYAIYQLVRDEAEVERIFELVKSQREY